MIQESEYLRMSDKKLQEDFSQILELIRTSHQQLEWVKQQGASVCQIASCVCTAREVLQNAEKQLNQLHRTAEIGGAAGERLQSMVMWKKERQRAREIGDAAKELWRRDIQRTTEVLEAANAKLMKAKRKLGSLQIQLLLRRLQPVSSQQVVDAEDATMRQWPANCQHALTVLNAVKRQVRKEK